MAGGVRVLEVTVRTPAGLEAIRAIAEHVPEAVVGAGTLRRPLEFHAVRAAGAHFGVSPGLTPTLVDAVADSTRSPQGRHWSTVEALARQAAALWPPWGET